MKFSPDCGTCSYCQGSEAGDANVLKIGLASGHMSLAKEKAALVDAESGESKVDILIATPGRLVDHLQSDGVSPAHQDLFTRLRPNSCFDCFAILTSQQV